VLNFNVEVLLAGGAPFVGCPQLPWCSRFLDIIQILIPNVRSYTRKTSNFNSSIFYKFHLLRQSLLCFSNPDCHDKQWSLVEVRWSSKQTNQQISLLERNISCNASSSSASTEIPLRISILIGVNLVHGFVFCSYYRFIDA
jgi:hypothetical protein